MSEIDPRLNTWVERDIKESAAHTPELEALWTTLEQEIDHPGWRDPFVSAPTSTRMLAALTGVAAIGAFAVAAQGLRGDLQFDGWVVFGALGGALMVFAGLASLLPLRSRAATPALLWPLIPTSWLVLLAFSAVAPWPGLATVPASAHLYCFGATTIAALVITGWLALWERSVSPVPQRIGLAATGAGVAAFVFQGLFCPGAGVLHLVVGHAAPTIALSTVIIGLALMLRR